MKKVSVIIPAYNKSEYTRRTVESVLIQTYSNVEIIVVDDGSSDETAKVMSQFAGRIHFIQKVNGGCCSARNAGIRKSSGEYLTFLDCDDLLCPEKLQQCVDYLDKNPRFGFVYTAAYFIDENDQIVGSYNHPRSKEGKILDSLIAGNFICNSTVVVRREVLEEAGLFDETIFIPADWDMWLRLSKVSQAGYINQPLLKYRVTDNYTFNRIDKGQEEERYVLEKFFKGYPDDGLRKMAFSSYYLRFAMCAYIKDDYLKFWSDCRESFRLAPRNIKTWAIMGVAIINPAWLKKELKKRILRKG